MTTHRSVVDQLRERIARLEGGQARERRVLPFGVAAVDQGAAGRRIGAWRAA